jgi:hypothetical protein
MQKAKGKMKITNFIFGKVFKSAWLQAAAYATAGSGFSSTG